MMKAQKRLDGHVSDRRGVLLGGATLAASSMIGAPAQAASVSQMEGAAVDLVAFAFITKRSELTDIQLRERYENGHVPDALRAMIPMGLRHYVRNYIEDAIGLLPDYQVISEFGFKPGGMGPDVCGSHIDPNWARNRSAQMLEYAISGRAASDVPSAVRKRAVLLRRPQDVSLETFTSAALEMSRLAARDLGDAASRVSLYLTTGVTREVHQCVKTETIVDAVLMIWPEKNKKLPTGFSASSEIAMTAILDLTAIASVIGI